MVAEPFTGVWRGKWAEVTASFNSEDDYDDDNCEDSLAVNQMDEVNGNEIRRSARPRRIAAKAAEADFSSMSGDGVLFMAHYSSRMIGVSLGIWSSALPSSILFQFASAEPRISLSRQVGHVGFTQVRFGELKI